MKTILSTDVETSIKNSRVSVTSPYFKDDVKKSFLKRVFKSPITVDILIIGFLITTLLFILFVTGIFWVGIFNIFS